MKTIKEEKINEVILKKSKFISIIKQINSIDDFKLFLDDIKNKYPNATHYCYAFVINNLEKANDDGEPSNTAGLPILNTLKNNDLKNVACIVVRYYGGVKLGTGGLIRAYRKGAGEVIKNNVIELFEMEELTIEFDYEDSKDMFFILDKYNAIIKEKEFDEKIKVRFEIIKEEVKNLKKELLKATII